jgi:hypothetical protein
VKNRKKKLPIFQHNVKLRVGTASRSASFFDANLDPDLDRHQNGNSDPDSDGHQNDAVPINRKKFYTFFIWVRYRLRGATL